jgi:hypothetical protein
METVTKELVEMYYQFHSDRISTLETLNNEYGTVRYKVVDSENIFHYNYRLELFYLEKRDSLAQTTFEKKDNTLYCNCSKPTIVKRDMVYSSFNYCTKCKKEKI